MEMLSQSCVAACEECARACEVCCAACIDENHPECVKVTGDCAQLCWNTASFASRGSSYFMHLARLCVEICEAAAKECARFESEHHQEVVRTAERCADECRKLTAGMPAFGEGKRSTAATNFNESMM